LMAQAIPSATSAGVAVRRFMAPRTPPLSADFGRFSADFQQMFADVRRFRVLYIIE
jgi:hypothetical protein